MRSSFHPVRSPYHDFILSQPNDAKRVLSLIENGRALLENGQNDEARRLFLQALSIYPHAIPALNNLALISIREGDYVRALNIIDEVLQCDETDPIAHGLAAQCWYHRESDPLLRVHVEASLSSYITLVKLGDPVDPGYPERAFPFVFQALLIAEDDSGIVMLHDNTPDRSWTPLELTWVGVANFNRGKISHAHLIWRRATRGIRYEPALIYATLAQHVLSEDLLPFTLDYDIVLPDDDEFPPYASSSLGLAQLVNDVYREQSKVAQELIVLLTEHDLPAQEYFLRRLVQNEQVAPGVRMAAGIHLLWVSDDEPLVTKLLDSFRDDALNPEDRPTYYLLKAAMMQMDDAGSQDLEKLVDQAYSEAAEQEMGWIIQYLDELFSDDDEALDLELDLFGSLDEDQDWIDDEELFSSLFPVLSSEPEPTEERSESTQKRGKRGGPSKGHRRKS